jgi:hypothetical protein
VDHGMTLEQIRKIFLAYPGVSEAPSYGTPGFRVRKKLLARINEKEAALVLMVADLDEQEGLMLKNPDVFFITDHYAGYPAVLARLSKAKKRDVQPIFEEAWRARAAGKDVAAFDAARKKKA